MRATSGQSLQVDEDDYDESLQQDAETNPKNEDETPASQAPASAQPSQAPAHVDDAKQHAPAATATEVVDSALLLPSHERCDQVGAKMER